MTWFDALSRAPIRPALTAVWLILVSLSPAFPGEVAEHAESGGAGPCAELDDTLFAGTVEEVAQRCDLIKELKGRGVVFPSLLATKILQEMSRPFATSIELTGEVPLSRSAIDFLFYELPDTARLVNHFNDTLYRVDYTQPDRSEFFATNGRKTTATFYSLDSRITDHDSNYLMFESGSAKLLFWKFKGNTIVELDYAETGEATRYLVRVYIFTDSKAYRSFFDSALFRYLLGSMFRQILRNIVSAVNQLTDSHPLPQFDNPSFVDELLQRLEYQ